eukprot:CAMPEP_0195105126 /NCGR_PEP_ID=MMETSP0448-20130528/75061_1 /TAXON_ID=66468 /ORGANISM="Heterocapsa triquestra, Strain CCMP 448" /LENGTH=148 /DNA_ID=CAMNT_0040141093 /DNA_START=147 /DNA_END=590 /DNA_ORIENTATION=-
MRKGGGARRGEWEGVGERWAALGDGEPLARANLPGQPSPAAALAEGREALGQQNRRSDRLHRPREAVPIPRMVAGAYRTPDMKRGCPSGRPEQPHGARSHSSSEVQFQSSGPVHPAYMDEPVSSRPVARRSRLSSYKSKGALGGISVG